MNDKNEKIGFTKYEAISPSELQGKNLLNFDKYNAATIAECAQNMSFENYKPINIDSLIEIMSFEVKLPVIPKNILYAPSIESWNLPGLKITDNEMNEGITVAYNIYCSCGKLEMTVPKTASIQEVKLSDYGHYFVTSVDAYGTESPASEMQNATCFVAGTYVTLPHGDGKLIETIKPGDEVLGYDFTTQKYCTATVSEVVTGYTSQLATVLIWGGHSIIMSSGHPLYTTDGWHSITNKNGYPTLKVGDKILTYNGHLPITDITIQNVSPTLVYSLSLDNGQGYFCGEGGFGSHMHGGGSN